MGERMVMRTEKQCSNCDHKIIWHKKDGCWFDIRDKNGNIRICPCPMYVDKELYAERNNEN